MGARAERKAKAGIRAQELRILFITTFRDELRKTDDVIESFEALIRVVDDAVKKRPQERLFITDIFSDVCGLIERSVKTGADIAIRGDAAIKE